MKAIDVFGAAIKYLKDHLLDLLMKRGTEIKNADVHWVLTVPAMLTNSAKQFLREAAYKADIDGEQLSIVPEPKASSLFCQLIPTNKLHESEEAKFAITCPGTKYMILDVQERITHISVHEKQADGDLKELYEGQDSFAGGNNVYGDFYKVVIKLIGGPVWQKFIDEDECNLLDFKRDFESQIKKVKPDWNGKITIRMPDTFATIYKEEMKEDISDAIQGSRYAGKIKWLNRFFRIEASVIKDLFKPFVDDIVCRVQCLLQKDSIKDTQVVVMIGSFSHFEMLNNALVKALPNIKVICPEEPYLFTLKGAVIFGHWPVAIRTRVSNYTYGIKITSSFDTDIHPEDHRLSVDGISRCRDVFKKYIIKGQPVRVGEAHSGKHVAIRSHQAEMRLEVFASTKSNPMFVDEDDSEYLGTVVINLPETEEKIRVDVNMIFGETELIVDAVELATHTKYRKYFL